MSRKLPTLEKRRRVVERTKDRFAGRVFELGSNDCAKLAHFHITHMGHKLPSTGHYKTPKEALRQLKRLGAKNLEEFMDAHLERISPAAMWLGDIAMPPSDPSDPSHTLGTLVIKVAPSKFLGWHPDYATLVVFDLSQIDAAWRV